MRNSTLLKSRVASTCYRLLVIILLSIPIGLLSQNVNKSKVKAITKSFSKSQKTANEDGTIANPFTNVDQITATTPNGLYYFNFGGNAVLTRVENGWVLVANDAGTPLSQDLAEVAVLDLNVRGILSNSVLSNLGIVNMVNLKSSNGALNVISTNTTIIDRVKQGQTLHKGQNDNTINDSWVGAGASSISDNAFCTTTFGITLKSNIIHTCGSSNGSNWSPSQGFRRVQDGSGNVANTISFGLWVRKMDAPVISSLSTLSGCAGSALVINGTSLATTQTVTVGGKAASITNITETSVSIFVNGTSGVVQLTTLNGTASSADSFTYTTNPAEPLGSSCNPFTSIQQVTAATPNGLYSFNLNGNYVETKVEDGWVLMANDAGTPVAQDLQELLNLDVSVRGIAPADVLSNLGFVNKIRIKSSDGALDVESTNTTLISRVKAAQTLHQGVNDNVINDSWTGTADANMTSDANCTTSQGTSLKGNVIHTCGSFTGANWMPNLAVRRISDGSGNVLASVSFGLWVKAAIPPTITSIAPISGCLGSTITITGTNLASVQVVTIGGIVAKVLSANATTVTAKVGGGTGTVTVSSVDGIASSTETFSTTTNLAEPLGSGCNPFTNIEQVSGSTPDGMYYFNLSGNIVYTKVEKGWVLVANDVGTPVSQNLQEVATLDSTVRGIVSASVLSNLGAINALKVKSSNAVLDVSSTNATLISRLKLGNTLHGGQADNAINDNWLGASAINVTGDATCNTTRGTDIKGNIFHTCGNNNGITWIPINGERMIAYKDDNVADSISFGLWVKKIAAPTITTLSSLTGCIGSTLVIKGTNLFETQTTTIGGTAATIISTTDTTVTVKAGNGTTGAVQVTTLAGTTTSMSTFTFANNPAELLGSGCNPFTNIQQITPSTPNGLYHFNLNGNVFETKVENGWVLVLNDAGTIVSQNLPDVTNLDVNVRGLLNSAVLSNLGLVDSVKIKSSDAALDVVSSNTSIISRLKAGQTIHQGQNDNAINDSWVGVSADRIKDDASCPTSHGSSLKGNIIHTCGNYTGTNWIPSQGLRKVSEGNGNVAASISFGLWVKAAIPPTITSVSPLTGCPGTTITITGTNLATVQTVTIGGANGIVLSANATTVTATVGGNSGTVTVTGANGTATSADVFTVSINPTDQLGSVCNPFTSMEQVTVSTPDGLYHFNLGGDLVQTKVENGWVLVVNDAGASVSQDLQEVSSLDLTTRGIVTANVLSHLGNIAYVKVKSSNGVVDAITNNTTIITRLKQGETLHHGVNDNAINDFWTGASSVNLATDATCVSQDVSTLKGNVIHTCGLSTTLNWIPIRGVREITDASGFVGSGVSFGLWVKAVSGLGLWLKGDAGVSATGSNLTAWDDQTNTNTFTKVGAIGYQNNAINFNQAVVFSNPENETNLPVNRLDGNTDIIYVDGFAVYKSNRTKSTLLGGVTPGAQYGKGIFLSYGGGAVVGVGSGSSGAHSQFSNPNSASYNIANLDISLTSSPYASGRLNGLSQTLTHSGGTTFSTLEIKPMLGGTNNNGAANGWFAFDGEVAEIMLYPYSLTVPEKIKIESYLALKYGITLDNSVADYVNSSGTSIWSSTAYWHDVFGIGKDATLGLNQPQSNSFNTGSGDGTGQSGKGNIVLSNPSSLDDADFLMLGHDNGDFTEQTTDLPSSIIGEKRVAREWKVQQTGSVGSVSLTFSTLGIGLTGTAASDFSLLVDNDGDGDFTTGTVTEIAASNYTNNVASFSNVTLPNNAVFTFTTGSIPTTIQEKSVRVALYPNPTKGDIRINLGQFSPQTVVSVFNVVGTKISERVYSLTNAIYLNIEEPSGIYYVEVNIDGNREKFKVIKH